MARPVDIIWLTTGAGSWNVGYMHAAVQQVMGVYGHFGPKTLWT